MLYISLKAGCFFPIFLSAYKINSIVPKVLFILIGHYLFQVLNPLLWDALLYTQSSRTVNEHSGVASIWSAGNTELGILPAHSPGGSPPSPRNLEPCWPQGREWLSPPSAPAAPLGDGRLSSLKYILPSLLLSWAHSTIPGKVPKVLQLLPTWTPVEPKAFLEPHFLCVHYCSIFFFCFIFNNVFLKRLFMGERKIQWELDLFNHLEIVFFLEVGLLWLLLCVFLYKKFLMALWMRLNLVFLSSRYCCSKHHKLGELSQVPGPSVSSSGLYSFM